MTPRAKVSLMMATAGATAVCAGCGSSPSRVPARTAGGPAAPAFAYARCMRQHGVADFPDPHVTTTPGGGSVKIAMMAPASVGNSPASKTAEKACRGILPLPGSNRPDGHGPSKQVVLAFAHCLRSHGMTGFPDPTAQGELTREMISAAGVDVHSREFVAAGKACIGVTHGQITVAQVEALASGQH
jgi:hypothetical protein